MERGDLSNRVSPSLVIVFEGAIGVLKEEDRENFIDACYEERWSDAVNAFYLNDLYLRKINDLTWRQGFNIEVCTWMGHEIAFFIGERLDQENLVIHSVWSEDPDRLSRHLAYLPRIARIYDPDPSHRFKFGSKGELLTSPHQIGRF